VSNSGRHSVRQASGRGIRGLAGAILLVAGWGLNPATADGEEAWSPVIIARGEYREQIAAQPIEQRPNRPFHFYGNTIRRQHHRGNPFPLPSDFWRTIQYALSGGTEPAGRR